MKRRTKVSRQALAVLEAIKEHGPATAPEIAKIMGMSASGVQWHMIFLNTQSPKLVHIAGYRPQVSRGADIRVWAAGDLPNVVKEPFVRSERRKSRAKTEQRPRVERELSDEVLERRHEERIRELAAATRPFRDPMIWCLFGDCNA